MPRKTFFVKHRFGVESIYRMHRLIGPIYVVEKIVKAIAAGDLTHDVRLREYDELKDFFSELISSGAETGTLKKEIREIKDELSTITSGYKI